MEKIKPGIVEQSGKKKCLLLRDLQIIIFGGKKRSSDTGQHWGNDKRPGVVAICCT